MLWLARYKPTLQKLLALSEKTRMTEKLFMNWEVKTKTDKDSSDLSCNKSLMLKNAATMEDVGQIKILQKIKGMHTTHSGFMASNT